MLNPKLIDAYRYRRSDGVGRLPDHARVALSLARHDIAEGRNRYPSTRGGMRSGADFQIGSSDVFWSEHPADYLRPLGFVDEISAEGRMRGYCIDHKGWFLDEDGDSGEVARGVVFQLPGKSGKPRYLSGVADPCNDGPAILSLDIFDDRTEAAHSADELARIYADHEKDYRRAANAGNRFAELGNDVAEYRKMILNLGEERRATVSFRDKFPAASKAACDAMRHAYRQILKARKERAALESDYGNVAAFNEAANGGI